MPTSRVHPILLVSNHPAREAVILEALRTLPMTTALTIAHSAQELACLMRSEADDGAGDWELALVDAADGVKQASDAMRALRAHTARRHTPLVCLVADVEPEIVAAWTMGAHSVLPLPDHPGELHDLMTGVARYWLTLNRASPRLLD